MDSLLVKLPSEQVDEILKKAQSENFIVTVDLETQEVMPPDGKPFSFQYDSFLRHCLLNAMDDIDYINSFQSEIRSFSRTNKNPNKSFRH